MSVRVSVERTVDESGRAGASALPSRDPDGVGRQPERQRSLTHPRLDAVLDQPLRGCRDQRPAVARDQLRGGQVELEGQPLADGVEDAADPHRRRVEQEPRQVADVDHGRDQLGHVGHEDGAVGCGRSGEPPGPVAATVERLVGTSDQARPGDQGALGCRGARARSARRPPCLRRTSRAWPAGRPAAVRGEGRTRRRPAGRRRRTRCRSRRTPSAWSWRTAPRGRPRRAPAAARRRSPHPSCCPLTESYASGRSRSPTTRLAPDGTVPESPRARHTTSCPSATPSAATVRPSHAVPPKIRIRISSQSGSRPRSGTTR